MRKYGAEELSCRSIFERAATLCSKLGLRCPSYDTVYNMFRSAFPLPIIVENDRARIWIDRYYIAHCILAAYVHPEHPDWKIWIITEWDRSATTLLFPDEY